MRAAGSTHGGPPTPRPRKRTPRRPARPTSPTPPAAARGRPHVPEPLGAASLAEWLPPHATLVVASSMPVRDVESFFPLLEDPPRGISNRGANGIHGTVSTAFGVAAVSDGPVVLLIGDVALAHDIGGLLAARRLGLNVKVVVPQNH